jgi:hypothetical protein
MQTYPSLRSAGQRLDGAIRRMSRYRGMLVIVLWQAPVGPYPGPDGSIGFLFGGGLDQFVTEFGCDGPTRTAAQTYGVAAVEFDRDIGRQARLEAVAGGITWSPRDQADWPSTRKSSGVFGQANLRWDWRKWGVGGGILVLPNMNHDAVDFEQSGYTALPSVHLRYGNSERMHGRIEVTPPNALGAQVPGRAGIGWNATRRDRPSWFVGFAVLGSSPELLAEGLAAEAAVPVSDRAAVRVLAHYGTGFDRTVSGIALGGRINLRSRPADASAIRPRAP